MDDDWCGQRNGTTHKVVWVYITYVSFNKNWELTTMSLRNHRSDVDNSSLHHTFTLDLSFDLVHLRFYSVLQFWNGKSVIGAAHNSHWHKYHSKYGDLWSTATNCTRVTTTIIFHSPLIFFCWSKCTITQSELITISSWITSSLSNYIYMSYFRCFTECFSMVKIQQLILKYCLVEPFCRSTQGTSKCWNY